MGIGKEKFRNDLDQISWYDSVFFPLYAPKSKKQKLKLKEQENKGLIPSDELNLDKTMNTEEFQLVKMKVRAIGADNKSRMKMQPAGSELRYFYHIYL